MQLAGGIKTGGNEYNVRRRVLEYLKQFYRNRPAPSDVRIVIERARIGFWMHNGGSSYASWRSHVKRNAARIRRRKKVRVDINETEESRRSNKLPTYQREMKAFAAFLREEVPESST
jgi:hypothetical protein